MLPLLSPGVSLSIHCLLHELFELHQFQCILSNKWYNPLGSSLAGCGQFTQEAVNIWLSIGGKRIDAANSYQNQKDVGIAMTGSGINRTSIFLLSKVGPSNPLGYQDSLNQFDQILSDMNTDYVDALLIHWPVQSISQVWYKLKYIYSFI